ncbi:hypothetical protein [Buttiauxella agrestis]|nr:hypothetical protein [Buttiauxella agrestis]
MMTSTVNNLLSNGFSPVRCPATQVVMPNMTRNFDGFHISYARSIQHYGSDTTAIVLQGRVFLLLNGYHADVLSEAAERSGIHGCIDIFIERIGQANKLSEHRMAAGIDNDLFELAPTVLDVIGQDYMDRLMQAVTNETEE